MGVPDAAGTAGPEPQDDASILRRCRRPERYTRFLETPEEGPAATPAPGPARTHEDERRRSGPDEDRRSGIAAALAAALTSDDDPADADADWADAPDADDRADSDDVPAGEVPADDVPGGDRSPGPPAGPSADRAAILQAPYTLGLDGVTPQHVARYLAHSCDLTVSGGLDVALAAPLAVCALAEHHVLRRIGGGSAGAVAAAAAAAAELGRTAPAPPRTTGAAPTDGVTVSPGFAGLADALAWLSGAGPAHLTTGSAADHDAAAEQGRLGRLFRPADDAADLHRLVTAASIPGSGRLLSGRWPRVARAALAGLDRGARRVLAVLWAGALIGSAGMSLALARSSRSAGWVLLIATPPLLATFALAAAAGSALLVAQAVRRALRQAAATDGWGLVSGSVEGSAGGDPLPPLFTWLADRIDDLAGVPAAAGGAERYALTFGDLWLGRLGRRTAADVRLLRRAAVRPQVRAVDLALVATDLSAGRPCLLPFAVAERPQEERPESYLFCRPCLIAVLPARVADQMVLLSPGSPAGSPAGAVRCPRHPDEPLHRLPEPWDLPVAFAVRLAAATPGVLRAVPLHRVHPEGGPQARTHWFCDGAVTGGLPPGLFDVPLPRWPAVALGPAVAPGPGNSDGDRGEDGDGVFAPDHGAVGPAAPWRPVAGPAGIIGALLTAATGWRAVLRAQAPALRGGTALLAADPDGLGPFHSQAAVLRLAGRGHRAGVALRERFTGPDGDSAVHTGTDRYRWARMRTALARWRRESLAIGAGIPLYTDLALAYRVPDDVAAWFSPPLEPGTADPAWGDAVAALTHLRSLAEGGVLDWDTEWGAAPTDPHDRLG